MYQKEVSLQVTGLTHSSTPIHHEGSMVRWKFNCERWGAHAIAHWFKHNWQELKWTVNKKKKKTRDERQGNGNNWLLRREKKGKPLVSWINCFSLLCTPYLHQPPVSERIIYIYLSYTVFGGSWKRSSYSPTHTGDTLRQRYTEECDMNIIKQWQTRVTVVHDKWAVRDCGHNRRKRHSWGARGERESGWLTDNSEIIHTHALKVVMCYNYLCGRTPVQGKY